MLHFLLVAALELGQSLGLFDTGFSLLGNSQAIKEVLEESARREEQRKQEQIPEAELVFVDVDRSITP